MTPKGAQVVVTGPPGSGKTTLAELIGHALGMRVVNVGDLLVRELSRYRVPLASRRDAGAAFIKRYRIDGYLALLDRAASPGTILDGVRLARGVLELKQKHTNMIHVHRLSGPESSPAEQFGDALVETGADADLIVQWQESRSGLVTLSKDVVLPFISSRFEVR